MLPDSKSVKWMIIVFSICLIIIRVIFLLLRKLHCKGRSLVIGILHPDNLGGGGGERVMWCLLQAMQEKYKKAHFVLYSTKNTKFSDIQKHIKTRFNLTLERPIETVNIAIWKRLYNAMEKYPFTLLMQSIASMIMAFVSLCKFTPHVWVDTTGFAFTYPLVKFFIGSKVVAYVHYPTISTDMLNKVKKNMKCVNNQSSIAKSAWKTNMKIFYYKFFAILYGVCGYFCDIVFVNSTWTRNHIVSLWYGDNTRVRILYPPICVEHFYNSISLAPNGRKKYIVSIGCFRPEKNHMLQIESFGIFLKKYCPAEYVSSAKLILIGGMNKDDEKKRVKNLKERVGQLGISKSVEFHENASFETLCKFCAQGIIGLHCMREEHFGMCLVEYSASGLIPLAHNSGGPKVDIVVDFKGVKTGFLAESKDEYARKMGEIIGGFFGKDEKKRSELREIQVNTKESSKRFTEELFIERAKKYLKF